MNTRRGRPLGSFMKKYQLAGKFMSAILVCIGGISVAQPAASAASNLSSVVLTSTLPGLVAAPPGGDNGPLGQSNLGDLPVSTDVGAKLLLALGDGAVSAGYFRAWGRQPANGDSVFIFAIHYKSSSAQVSWLKEVDAGLQAQPGGTTFSVPGISGADGYTAHVTTSAGEPSTANVVTFAKGGTIFILMVASMGDLTTADAASLATRQAAKAPGTSSRIYKEGAIAGGGVVVVLLLVMTLVRRSRNHSATSPAQPFVPRSSTISYPPPPTEFREPGWAVVGDANSVQWHWDGKAWTGRRQLTPAGWVEG
jgi:hypothetical protein